MLATSVAFARVQVAYIVVVVSEVERLVLVKKTIEDAQPATAVRFLLDLGDDEGCVL